MSTNLTLNVHVKESPLFTRNCYFVNGDYEYYHYLCDGFDDRGWGCGYRTLQTICSWMNHNTEKICPVPSVQDIQNILVDLGDKPKSFLNSRQWIGSFEVCLVIDKLYDIPCKIIHVSKNESLESAVQALKAHFVQFGSPVMMGGDLDCSSKGIMGIHENGAESSLLVVDPHYVGKEQTNKFLQSTGWVSWHPLQYFLASSFYNLCLPQIKSKYHV